MLDIIYFEIFYVLYLNKNRNYIFWIWMYLRYVFLGILVVEENKINGNQIKIFVGPLLSSILYIFFYITMLSWHRNFRFTVTRFSILWFLIKYFYFLWGILALTLKSFAYFPRSVRKLRMIYSTLPLTFLWSLNLLVFIKKAVCVLCEETIKVLNKFGIHLNIRIDLTSFITFYEWYYYLYKM
jgi:hypothetical protein